MVLFCMACGVCVFLGVGTTPDWTRTLYHRTPWPTRSNQNVSHTLHSPRSRRSLENWADQRSGGSNKKNVRKKLKNPRPLPCCCMVGVV
uniref:Putative secreted protein n=1 Tax=Anopheles marajoara TaxID=58244 RepID=A0A2M4CA50_9DIPT